MRHYWLTYILGFNSNWSREKTATCIATHQL